LSSRTFELLWYLAEHPLQVISKDQLMAALWPDSFVEEGNLTQQIFLLRKALASAGMEESLVVTVPGKGYQFAVTVEASEAVEHSETEQISPPSDFQGSAALSTLDGELHMHAVQSVTRVVIEEETEDELPAMRSLPEPRAWPKRRLWLTAVGALAVLAAGSFLGWRYLHKAPANGIDLVLSDFENRTGDPDFDHTLNQALLIDLEQTPYFHLLSRSRIQETLAEMQRKPDEVLTTPVAAEVCERNNALVMLHGQIFRVGGKYLLILNAESCVTGKQVAGYKAEASSKEEVLAALDKAAARVRRQLGESAASLDRYKIPIAQATTASLPALRAYSEAIDSFASGDRKAAQVQLERAVSFDPAFASAYRLLGSSYYNLFDFSEAAVYYKKAFDLRDRTTERERLGIEIMYYGYALNNYEESIRRIRQFLQVYPEDAESWVALSDQLTELGQYSQAIQAA
jgi:DNA-binding winged helix-turn-helix (wHTH) protein/tetratricopeptide (TPR) repeat protein